MIYAPYESYNMTYFIPIMVLKYPLLLWTQLMDGIFGPKQASAGRLRTGTISFGYDLVFLKKLVPRVNLCPCPSEFLTCPS